MANRSDFEAAKRRGELRKISDLEASKAASESERNREIKIENDRARRIENLHRYIRHLQSETPENIGVEAVKSRSQFVPRSRHDKVPDPTYSFDINLFLIEKSGWFTRSRRNRLVIRFDYFDNPHKIEILDGGKGLRKYCGENLDYAFDLIIEYSRLEACLDNIVMHWLETS